MQQLDRFQEAYRYRGKTPLKELWFEVHVWRSPVIEEDTRDLICHRLVQYGSKLLSPQERLLDLQTWARTASDVTQQQQQQQPSAPSADDGVEMTAIPSTTVVLTTTAAAHHRFVKKIIEAPTMSDLLGSQQVPGLGDPLTDPPSLGTSSTTPAAAGSPSRNQNTSESIKMMSSRLQSFFYTQQQLCLFSRPPCEDYIDDEEFVSPIEPRQAASPLARIALTQHRMQHRENPNMYLLWSLGDIIFSEEQYRKLHKHPSLGNSSLLTHNGGPVGDVELRALLSAEWQGSDVVMCTITSQSNSETTFLAKPSLGAEHTLLVTTKHIYTFQVTVVEGGRDADVLAASLPQGQLPEDLLPVAAPSSPHATEGGASNSPKSPERLRLSGAQPVTTATATSVAGGSVSLGTAGHSESERRSLLRQVLQQASDKSSALLPTANTTTATAANGDLPPLTTINNNKFTPFPPIRSAFGPMKRLHIFGTIESIRGVHRSTLFVRAQWLLPNPKLTGVELDHSADIGGVEEVQPLSYLSQMSFGSHMLNAEYQYDTVHHINLPFELNLVVPQQLREGIRLVFTVYTAGSGANEPQAVVGYGTLTIAQLPGMIKSAVQLWTPRQTGWEYLKSVFLGGGPSLTSVEDVGIPPWVTETNSKAGLIADSSGEVVVHYATVWQQCAPIGSAVATAVANNKSLDGGLNAASNRRAVMSRGGNGGLDRPMEHQILITPPTN